MAARGESLDSRVARLEEAMLGFKEDRIESRQDRKDIIARLDQMNQVLQSTGAAVATLTLQDCGTRLTDHDGRIAALENKTKNLPVIETEVMFWRRVLGGGFHAFWKVAGALLGSGIIGAGIAHWLHW